MINVNINNTYYGNVSNKSRKRPKIKHFRIVALLLCIMFNFNLEYMEKHIVGINNIGINREKAILKEAVKNLNKGREAQAMILGTEPEEFDADKVFDFLRKSFPDFKNLSLTANLLDKGEEYSIIVNTWEDYKQYIPEVDYDSSKGYYLSQQRLDAIKERHTTYLNQEKAKYASELLELTKKLNALPKKILSAVYQNREGEFYINISRVHNSDRIF